MASLTSVLSPAQLKQLRELKIKTRIDNERYLRQHPEVQAMIGSFMREILETRPENVREYAAKYFTNPQLKAHVAASIKRIGTKTQPLAPINA